MYATAFRRSKALQAFWCSPVFAPKKKNFKSKKIPEENISEENNYQKEKHAEIEKQLEETIDYG